MKRVITYTIFFVSAMQTAFMQSEPSQSNQSLPIENEFVQPAQWYDNESFCLESATNKFIGDYGFAPHAKWIGEQWSNVSGGLSKGTQWDSLLVFGFNQDLSKLCKEKNYGRFGISVMYYTQTGDFAGDKVNAKSDPSNILSSGMFRVYEIFYTNEFETNYGNIVFRIGQLAADEDFMNLDYSSIFLNSSFGAIPANAGDIHGCNSTAFSQYPLATFGFTLFWNKDDFYAIIGIYNGDCGDDISTNHGFSYDIRDVAIWYQGGYNYSLYGRNGKIIAGGNFHSGEFENCFNGYSERNFYSFYFGMQQNLIADKDGKDLLGVFARIGWAPDEHIAYCSKYLDCGILWFGPIPTRDDDILAIGYSVMGNSSGIRHYENSSEFDNMVEFTYRMQIAKSIVLQPAFQTYFNAKNEYEQTRVAYVVGLRLEINF